MYTTLPLTRQRHYKLANSQNVTKRFCGPTLRVYSIQLIFLSFLGSMNSCINQLIFLELIFFFFLNFSELLSITLNFSVPLVNFS